MSFRLKNVRATLKRLMNKMFSKMIRKIVEVSINDILVKCIDAKDHVKHLQEECFNIQRKNGIKLNLAKCTFGVS